MKKKVKQKKSTNNKFNFDNEFIIGVSPSNNIKKNKEIQKKKVHKKPKKKSKIRIKVKTLVRNVCILLFIFGTIAFFLVSPTFNVQQISVENNSKIPADTIISLSEIKLYTNIFKVNKKDAIKKLKIKNRYIEDVEIKKKLPNKIIIKIEEREPEYLIEIAEGKYTYVNSQGYLLENSSEKLDLPILTGISTEKDKLIVPDGKENSQNKNDRLNDNDLKKLNTVLKITELTKEYEINKMISKIDISDDNNYTLYLDSENKIAYLGDETNLHTKVLYLKEILEAEKETKGEIFLNVDLNEDNVYYRESV